MFIQTEATPNPSVLKFLPGCAVMGSGTAEFVAPEQADISPLASALFRVEGVEGVYLGADFISITKAADKEWLLLKPALLGIIMDHFVSGRPVLLSAGEETSSGGEDDDDVVVLIKDLLDTRIRPAVAQDGGDITFLRFEEGVVWLRMRGACAGCPSSTATLKGGIENMLRHYVPEVLEVRAG
jgi:Fe-S cluster biogenesis protein NfuA